MGHCCESRCPNVAHGWQMGWYGLQAIDGSDLKPGTTLKVTLAPGAVKAAGTVQQGVRLNVSGAAAPRLRAGGGVEGPGADHAVH